MKYKFKIKNVIENNRGTALFLTLIILSSVLIVSLGAADLIVSGVKQARTQLYSVRSYFAAEAGAERVLWEIRKNNFTFLRADNTACQANDYVNFDNINIPPNMATCGNEQVNALLNGATYSVIFKSGGAAATTTRAIGGYHNTERSVEISY